MADETSKNGKWIDNKTGQVVSSEPEEGVQLLAPGVPETPDVTARIKAAEDAAADTGDSPPSQLGEPQQVAPKKGGNPS